MKKRFFLLSALFTFCVIVVSIFLVCHYIHLNYAYIVNPESSPGYSCGTPFGDGGDVWETYRTYLPTVLLASLILFNMLDIAMHFCTLRYGHTVFLVASTIAMFAIVIVVLMNIELPFLALFSFFLLLPEFLLIPTGIVLVIIFFVRKKMLIAGHMVLLVLSMIASFLMEWFSCFLYLD